MAALLLPGECGSDRDCGGARCQLDDARAGEDQEIAPRYCGAPLPGGRSAGAVCVDGPDCQSGLCALVGRCVTPCGGPAGACAAGHLCTAVQVRWGRALQPTAACVPSTNLDLSVDAAQGDILTPSVVPGSEDMELYLAGLSRPSLVQLGGRCGTDAVVVGLRTASEPGVGLFDLGEAVIAGVRPLNPVVSFHGDSIQALLPNNPVLQPSQSGYWLGIAGEELGDFDTLITSRAAPGRWLDLHVYHIGGGGWSSGDPRFEDVLDGMDAILEPHGLGIGEVREHELGGALLERLQVLEQTLIEDELGNVVDIDLADMDLVRSLSAGVVEPGLHLFLVRDMGDILGISGGIPGALGVPGSFASGVVLAVDVIPEEELAQVVLHEIGHQLGLFHTSEFGGGGLEGLSDTPACPISQDRNLDGFLMASECVDFDGGNLMFWEGRGASLSAQQAEVLRQSTALR